jgi:hypothetical protein
MVPNETPTLYTSTPHDGALAEITHHWSQLTPLPSKPAAIHRIQLATRRTLRLARAELVGLGVDWDRYGEPNYKRTQEIGAAIAHLDCDGLIAPSARWSCDNVMLFLTNNVGDDDISILVDSTEVDWLSRAKANGRIAPEKPASDR